MAPTIADDSRGDFRLSRHRRDRIAGLQCGPEL